jgi:hypothetical protein
MVGGQHIPKERDKHGSGYKKQSAQSGPVAFESLPGFLIF